MARIISFAHTTPAVVNGFKVVTRRAWKLEYAARWKAGDPFTGWDYSPRVVSRNPAPILEGRLTADPEPSDWLHAPDEDWEGEGFHYLFPRGGVITLGKLVIPLGGPVENVRETWERFKGNGGSCYVVRFEVVKLLPGADRYRDVRPVEEIPLVRLEGSK